MPGGTAPTPPAALNAGGAQRGDPPARPVEPQPPQQLLGDRQVVGGEVGAVVEDRHGPLGRFGVRDRGPDRGVEQLLSEVLAQRVERLAGVAGPHVGDVQHDAEPVEVRVEVLARQLDHLERLLDALEREVLGLGRDQRVVGGDERVDREQAERRRAVDHDQVVVVAELAEGLLERELAAHLAAQGELGLGEPEIGRDDPVVHGRAGLGAPGQNVADRRRRIGIDVEVVREVSLRIEVDREHAELDAPEDVGERPHRGRLAGAALL